MKKTSIWFFVAISLIALVNCEDDDCAYPCHYNLDPVCGDNGQEFKYFGNECFMKRHNHCHDTSKFN